MTGQQSGDDTIAADLAFALELADLADSITSPYYDSRSFSLDWKSNRTEVTEADRGAEAALSERIVRERRQHAVFGEEHGSAGASGARRTWIIDPIDGTSNFVRGIPVWATLIALVADQDEVVLGVVSAPAMGRRWWAARGSGAFVVGRDGTPRPIHVSTVDDIAEAQVCVTFSSGWDALGLTHELVALQQRARRARGFGDFWQHMLVAEGSVDLAIDAVGVAPYDLAALKVIVEEAGGRFTDRHGSATFRSDTAISSNGVLHTEVEVLSR